jgi:hypothetical protein
MNSRFYLTVCINFFTFISHLVSLQSKQPLFFPEVYRGCLVDPEAVFLGVAMKSLLSDEEVLSANESNSSKGPELLIRPLDSPHIFTDVSRDHFPYCTFGITTQWRGCLGGQTWVTTQNGHNFLSDRWIALKFLQGHNLLVVDEEVLSASDTTKRLMSSLKCRSVKVINILARLGSNHKEVNYINYK